MPLSFEKEKAGVLKEIAFVSGKLNNEKFVAKAPEKLIEEEKAKALGTESEQFPEDIPYDEKPLTAEEAAGADASFNFSE